MQVVKTIVSKNVRLDSYELNDLDDVGGGTTYIGKSRINGDWLIERILQTGNDLEKGYANVSNNSSYLTYTDAWDNRLTLLYEDYNNLS